MATNKTITPTNVTVSVPAFTDQPDQRVNSNCIDKIIDGVNTGPVSSKVMQAYYDSTYDYYGIETKNVGAGTNGYVALLMAPGADRLQLKYTKNGTTTTKNFTVLEDVTNDSTYTSIKKQGRVCAGSFNISATSTSGTAGTLSAAFKPADWVRGVCRKDDISAFGKFDINPSTGVITYQVPSTGTYYAMVSYISAS